MAPPQKKSLKTSSLYKSVTRWSLLIQTSQEAPKEPENPGPQNEHPLSLLPHILLSRHNPSYRWPLKLLQGVLQRPPPNQISLSSFPNHLRNPREEQEDLEDPFLSDQISLTLMKPESELASSMLFEDVSAPKEEVEEEETTLLTMSPMKTISRTMSPSPRPETSSLWDPSHKSSMETKLEQMHSSQSTSGT